MIVKLRMSGTDEKKLRDHLYPGDGKESVAFALCGRRSGDDAHCLSVNEIRTVPNDVCLVREPDRVTWPTSAIKPMLDEAARRHLAVVKFHSHPSGFAEFSKTDDIADLELLSSIQVWTDSIQPHGSAVVLPSGEMFGRWLSPNETLKPMDMISVAGTDIRFWFAKNHGSDLPDFALRNAQAFGRGTTNLLRMLSVAVIGCSGTGSPMIEMLARHGVGRILIVDPDVIEVKNLNRIIFARMRDVGRNKAEVATEWIESTGLGASVESLPTNLCRPMAIKRVAECDIVVGCMDGAEGRYLLNKLASFYCLPYFDVGVRLDADRTGGVSQICGTVNYLQPGGSSLLSRRAITMDQVQSEGLKRTNPEAYQKQVKENYIHGVAEDRPAVSAVNMHYSSLAMLEILARLHSFRVEGNEPFAQFGSSLTDPRFEPVRDDGNPCNLLSKHVGRGDSVPLLDNPYLSEAVALELSR